MIDAVEVFAVRRKDGSLLQKRDTKRGAPRIWTHRNHAELTIAYGEEGLTVEPMLLVPRRVRVRAGSRYYPPRSH